MKPVLSVNACFTTVMIAWNYPKSQSSKINPCRGQADPRPSLNAEYSRASANQGMARIRRLVPLTVAYAQEVHDSKPYRPAC